MWRSEGRRVDGGVVVWTGGGRRKQATLSAIPWELAEDGKVPTIP
jgi:hypothetical protein